MSARPHSLRQVAERARAGASLDLALRNFLDEFHLHPRLEMLLEEPPSTGRTIDDCYLAATADELGSVFFQRVPGWAQKPERHLPEPWFGFQSPLGRAYALIFTPSAFRERNLFIGEDALQRV